MLFIIKYFEKSKNKNLQKNEWKSILDSKDNKKSKKQ